MAHEFEMMYARLANPPAKLPSVSRAETLVQILTSAGREMTYTELQMATGWTKGKLQTGLRRAGKMKRISRRGNPRHYRYGVRPAAVSPDAAPPGAQTLSLK